ncbi:MAG: hypothetical protein HC808_10115 [Candidatus Competibacteraceae bacterium]|nr:hypothetical protein [Candidatus Competibacteraceae bacterium]
MANLLEQILMPTSAPSGGGLLDSPFFMNLLAQSGYSTTPQSSIGAVGQAALATRQQQQQESLNDFKNRLIETEIKLNEERLKNPYANQAKPPASIAEYQLYVEQTLAAGQQPMSFEAYKTRFGGSQFITLSDGTVVQAPRSFGGQTPQEVVSPEQAADAATRQAQTKARQTLPTDLASLDSTINTADQTISKIRDVLPLVKSSTVGIESAVRSDLPGFLGGEPRQLAQAVKSLQANFGFDTLQKCDQRLSRVALLGRSPKESLIFSSMHCDR